jgi:hypothetical protein
MGEHIQSNPQHSPLSHQMDDDSFDDDDDEHHSGESSLSTLDGGSLLEDEVDANSYQAYDSLTTTPASSTSDISSPSCSRGDDALQSPLSVDLKDTSSTSVHSTPTCSHPARGSFVFSRSEDSASVSERSILSRSSPRMIEDDEEEEEEGLAEHSLSSGPSSSYSDVRSVDSSTLSSLENVSLLSREHEEMTTLSSTRWDSTVTKTVVSDQTAQRDESEPDIDLDLYSLLTADEVSLDDEMHSEILDEDSPQ